MALGGIMLKIVSTNSTRHKAHECAVKEQAEETEIALGPNERILND
jgi:hypothetical protein